MKRPWPAIAKFWVLALLAICVLGWSSYQALSREHAAFKSRAYWTEQTEFRRVVDRLDMYMATLVGRESTLSFDDFQSFRTIENTVMARSIRGGLDSPPGAPVYLPTTLLTTGRDLPNPELTRLHFTLAENLSVPGIPEGTERSIALSREYTDDETLSSLESAKRDLIRILGKQRLQSLGQAAEQIQAKQIGGARSFTPLFVEPQSVDQDGPELLLVRVDPTSKSESILQCVWYDWPLIKHSLTETAQVEFPGPSYAITATMNAATVAAASGLATTHAGGGQLANLAARISISPKRTIPLPLWTQLTTNLVIAWLVCLAALFAIHSAISQAAALSERRAQFASAVTHELRTPLTTLCMYTEMLSAGLVKEEARDEYYATIKTEADRLAALIDNVLDHSGLEHGRSLKLETIDLVAWIDRQRLDGIELEIAPDQPISVHVDPPGLERVLGNLVDNARRYGAAPVRLSVQLNPQTVQLRISDNGPGIANPKEIFASFVQGQSAPRDSSSTRGLGLGLSLSRNLARAMGGELSLESPGPATAQDGQGKLHAREPAPTTFLLRVPRVLP